MGQTVSARFPASVSVPSDVFGGYLVAALWMALAVAGLRAAERRWPPARSRRRSGGVRAGAVSARVPQ